MIDVMDHEHGATGPVAKFENSRSSSEFSLDMKKDDSINSCQETKRSDLDSQVPVFSPEHSSYSPVMSSATQPVMGHPSGYDPNRLPSTIFASKPATGMDWSVASNESLFSIHIGNTSFPRDHPFTINKSGELPRLDDTTKLHPVMETENPDRKSEDMGTESDVTEDDLDNAIQVEPQGPKAMEVPGETKNNVMSFEKLPPDEVRNSNSSTTSFQFPILDANIKGNASALEEVEKQPSQKELQQEEQPQLSSATQETSSQKIWSSCSSCFSCFSCW